jgi:outer membrane protein assembly factor BamD (BamD/ComL family)
LRPEVGRPLQAAQDLIKSGKYREALAKVREAEAAGARNANETYLIERMRLAAASGAGDAETAARSYEALSNSSRITGPEKLRMIESIAGSYYRAQQYAKAMQWSQRYLREGGTSPAMRTMLIQSQYLSGDYAGAIKELTVEIQAAERAGSPPPEDRLKLLLNAASKQNDNNAYVFAMEKLVTYYPKKEYWVDL